MKDLCFAEFTKCLQKAIQPPNSNKDVVTILLGWITDLPGVLDRNGNPITLPPSLISNLLKRQVEVPKAIRDACTDGEIIDAASYYFKTKVLDYLNPSVSEDMFQEMMRAIMNDAVIAESTKKEFKKLVAGNDKNDQAQFLGKLLIYVIHRSNILSEKDIEASAIPYLTEVDNVCPLCQEALIRNVGKKEIGNYRIIKIYPDDISNDKEGFSHFKIPEDIDSPDNKLALCDKDANDYLINPTAKTYKKLRKLKDHWAARHSANFTLNSLHLEPEIYTVVDSLFHSYVKTPGIENNLPLNALRIDQKIPRESFLLRDQIKYQVLSYYPFINGLFADKDRTKPGFSNLIAAEMNLAYLKLQAHNLSPDEIVIALSRWIRIKSNMSDQYFSACQIIVAYFIQHCEVFHEISK